MATDSSQRVVWRWDADAFGQGRPDSDPDGDGKKTHIPLRFAGQISSEGGVVYNYFRYYDPNLGRYITSDPIGLAGGANTYTYVYNNPLYYVDPYGLFDVRGFLKKTAFTIIVNGVVGAKVLGLGALTHSPNLACGTLDCNPLPNQPNPNNLPEQFPVPDSFPQSDQSSDPNNCP